MKERFCHNAGSVKRGIQRKIIIENQPGDTVIFVSDEEFGKREAKVVKVYPKFVLLDMGSYRTCVNALEFMQLKGAKCNWE